MVRFVQHWRSNKTIHAAMCKNASKINVNPGGKQQVMRDGWWNGKPQLSTWYSKRHASDSWRTQAASDERWLVEWKASIIHLVFQKACEWFLKNRVSALIEWMLNRCEKFLKVILTSRMRSQQWSIFSQKKGVSHHVHVAKVSLWTEPDYEGGHGHKWNSICPSILQVQY